MLTSSKEQSDGKECGIVGNAGKNTWISGVVNGRCGKEGEEELIIRRIGKSRYIKSSTSWVKKIPPSKWNFLTKGSAETRRVHLLWKTK